MGEEAPQGEGEPVGTEEEEYHEVDLCGMHDGSESHEFHMLTEDREAMCAVTEDRDSRAGWVKVTAVVDSGSAENAMPPGAVPFIGTEPSEGSRSGKVYRGAGGEPIPNQGQKVMVIKTLEGQSRKSNWQVCPVTRPLMSVARITAAGNRVYFDEKSPHIKNLRTGEITKLRKEGNMFVIDFWVKKPGEAKVKTGEAKVKTVKFKEPDGDVVMSAFRRQGW